MGDCLYYVYEFKKLYLQKKYLSSISCLVILVQPMLSLGHFYCFWIITVMSFEFQLITSRTRGPASLLCRATKFAHYLYTKTFVLAYLFFI